MRHLLILLATLMLLTGCINQQVRPGGAEMKPHPWRGSASLWVKPGTDAEQLARYTRFIIDPATIHYDQTAQFHNISLDQLEKIERHFPATIRRHLEHKYQVVDQAGPATLRIKLSLTGAQRVEAEKELRDFIPLRLAIDLGKDAYNSLTEQEDLVLVGTLRLEGYDSVTNERLFIVVDRITTDKVTHAKQQPSAEDINQLMEMWAKGFRASLDRLDRETSVPVIDRSTS